MKSAVLILALGLSTSTVAVAANSSIESFVEEKLPESGAPGLSYAVVTNGEVASLGAHGVATLGDETPVTVDTPFLVGSITKSFTALAVMQLVERGSVELDAPVSVYLDEFAGSVAGSVTVRQLLSHTSGYTTLQGNQSHTDGEDGPDALARTVSALSSVAPANRPNTTWQYSNTNYQILGRLIEVVSGQAYQTYIEQNILEPLGMNDSFMSDGDVHDVMATGHRSWFGTKRPVTDTRTHRTTAPQGGLISSADDLAVYLQMMMNGEDDVLSAVGKHEMMSPASDLSPYYGLGWYLDPDSGTVWHGGTSPGFETLATMVPSMGDAAVVLVNAGSGMGFKETQELQDGITALALGWSYSGPGSRFGVQSLFVALVLLPLFYIGAMAWAWRFRAAIRAKSGAAGIFSLWFPLVTTVISAWVILWLMPSLLGAPIGTLRLFQPDLGLVLIAGAVAGVVWALVRLTIAYTGRP